MMMKKIDLNQIFVNKGVDRRDVAAFLYPEHKKPVAALNRIIHGKAELTASEIAKIAEYLNCSVDDLYSVHGYSMKSEARTLIFKSPEFEVCLDMDTFMAYIYKDKKYVSSMLVPARSIPVSEFIEQVEEYIKENNDERV